MAHDEFVTKQRARADGHLAEFLAGHPECAVEGDRPEWLKGTHLVTFGTCAGRPAVFKYYDGDPRKGYEKRTLELFGSTGLAPRVYAETDVMLVMERLAGATFDEVEKRLGGPQRAELCCDLGRAVARVVAVAPGGELAAPAGEHFRAAETEDFYALPYDELHVLYRRADTETFFETTLARAARVLRDRAVPHKQTLARSLALLQDNRDAMLAYKRFVHMDDFHGCNIMADGTRVTGFIDLEMTRSGNEPMLLGAALASFARRPGYWPAFRRGYEAEQGSPVDGSLLRVAQVMAPFSAWIRVTWYWSTDDLPWWAKEGDLRTSAVRQVAGTFKAAEGTAL